MYDVMIVSLLLMLILSLSVRVEAVTNYSIGEAFVTTDAPIYKPGQQIVVQAYIYPSMDTGFTATVKFYFTDLPNAPSIPSKIVTIPSYQQSPVFIVNSDPVTLPEVRDGYYHVKMEIWAGDTLLASDTVEFKVVHGPPTPDEPMILFVWHNHQAPNYLPNGRFLSYWHIGHFFHDGLSTYFKMSDYGYQDMGTYYLHYYLVKKYPHLKVNLHYSPSLLYQLYIAQEKGFRLYDPSTGTTKHFGPESALAQAIRDFFKGLKQLMQEDRIYLMTSVFAHTIQGYIIEKYKVSNMLRYDLELGKYWTSRLVTSTDAMWTPEMAWSDLLRDIYTANGIRYTVLDGTYHFPGSRGDKGTIYEPYKIYDSHGNELIVFFRDQPVSDGYIAFTNNDWGDPRQADRDARALYYKIYDDLAFTNYPKPIVTIAADGENWILLAPSSANGALFLDRIYQYIDKLTVEGIMMSGTFRDAVQYHPPTRKLDTIPWTSWLGGWGKWTTEGGKTHREEWAKLDQHMAKYLAYKYWRGIDSYSMFKNLVETSPAFNKSIYDLMIAIDSDYWWWDFFSAYFIDSWLSAFDKDSKPLLNYTVKVDMQPKPVIIGGKDRILVTIKNNNDYDYRDLTIEIVAAGLNTTTVTTSIKAGSSYTASLVVVPKNKNPINVRVKMRNPGTIVSSIFIGKQTYYFHDETYTIKLSSQGQGGGGVAASIDLMVTVSVTDSYGNYADIDETVPGIHTFTIAVSTANGRPVPEDTPIKLIIYINGKKALEEDVTIPRGQSQIVLTKEFNLDQGTYTYKVLVEYPGDPDTSNNVATGTIKALASPPQQGGGGTSGIGWDVVVGITLIAISAIILVYALLFYGKKK